MKFYFNSPRFFYLKKINFFIKEIYYSMLSFEFKQIFRIIALFIFKSKSFIFFNDNTIAKITLNKLDAIYYAFIYNHHIVFYKNGKLHNSKNAAYTSSNKYKEFSLNGKCYGNHHEFNKKSWRRFVKMQAFL
jgi:hypothetical protein